MVNLSFILRVNAPLEPLWNYFSALQNIFEWDPNVRKSVPVNIVNEKIGSTYNLTTVFNNNESQVQYRLIQYQKYRKISWRGQNKMITAVDEIYFRQKGDKTQIQYRADICLKGFYWLFTPLIRSGLDKLTVEAKQGMKKKCEERFGQAE